jgi:hypothetical protein
MSTVSELVSKRIGNTIINSQTWSGIFYAAKAYDLSGDGTTDDYADLSTLINTTINGDIATIAFYDGEYRIGTSITIPENVSLMFFNGGVLKPDSGVTITINGAVQADQQRIFGGSGTISGSMKVEAVYPQWFGASGEGDTTTTGSITSGLKALTVASTSTFAAGQGISIAGAGAAGATLVTTVSSISGLTITLADAASTTVAGAVVSHDDTVAIQAAIDAAEAAGGGLIKFPSSNNEYICQGVTISGSNIYIDLGWNTIKKTSGSGYIFDFNGSLTQENVGIFNGILEGDPTVTANGGINFADDRTTDNVDGILIENIVCRTFAQYGISIGSVSNIYCKNIRIENHGSTAVGATVGIGFVLYPKNAQSVCIIDGLYSEINASSTLSSSAAVKIETCTHVMASKIHAINGTEEVISINSTDKSHYDNLIVEDTTGSGSLGMVLSSNDSVVSPAITNAKFDISKVKFVGNFSSAFVLSASGVTGCKFTDMNFNQVSNTSGNRIICSQNATVSNLVFENIDVGQLYLNLNSGTTTTSCIFRDISLNIGAFSFSGDDNIVNGLISVGAGIIIATGNDNYFNNCTSVNCTSTAFQLNGDRNIIVNSQALNPTGNTVFIQGGTANRYDIYAIGGTGVTNSGTDTVGRKKGPTSVRPTLTSKDEGYLFLDTTLDADGKPIWWNGTGWVDATGAIV